MAEARVRVLVDATAMPVERGGVARYVDELVHALDVDLAIACQPRDEKRFRAIAPHARIVPGPSALRWRAYRLLWEQIALPRIARRLDVDVVHSPHYTTPIVMSRTRVVTVHDVTFFTDPLMHRPIKRWFFTTWIRLSVRRADQIVVPSHATAQELENATGYSAREALVAHHGVDHDRFREPTADDVDSARSRHRLPRHYVLFLGTIEPRKNVPALIRAHAQLISEHADPPALVLAGAQGWERDIETALSEHPRPDLVRALGYIDNVDVVPLLGGADVVAYPSEGEGFGLPVLEAMASGAVVLTTRRLALPEVAGDGAAYCEPHSADIARVLTRLLDDPVERADLRARAIQRAAQFSWEASADAHVTAYRTGMAKRSTPTSTRRHRGASPAH